MRLTARRHDATGTWLENQMLPRCWPCQEPVARDGISRMTRTMPQ